MFPATSAHPSPAPHFPELAQPMVDAGLLTTTPEGLITNPQVGTLGPDLRRNVVEVFLGRFVLLGKDGQGPALGILTAIADIGRSTFAIVTCVSHRSAEGPAWIMRSDRALAVKLSSITLIAEQDWSLKA